MAHFDSILSLIFLLLGASITFAVAASHSQIVSHRTKRTINGRSAQLYHSSTIFETYGPGIEHSLSKRADATIHDSAVAFIQSRLGLAPNSTQLHSSHEGTTAHYAYLQQYHLGIPVANAVANVAFNKAHQVISFGSSFVQPAQIASSEPSINVEAAISSAESTLKAAHTTAMPQPTVEYLATQDGSLALVHVFQVRNVSEGTWYEAFVDAHSGQLLSITDFVSQATYRALPITKQVLTEGFEDLTDPEDPLASPLGWHNDGKTISNSTAGNNALSFKLVEANTTVQSGTNLTFVYAQDAAQVPTVQPNLDAARVNAFYIANMMHDISYRYGFTETAFNFQTDNFGLGGQGNDRMQVDVQASGFNNAEFIALPDGQNGFVLLYLWSDTDPDRDGALENDIVVHEYTHGITNRLTGGGTARCLQILESGGLGEGWSDAMAEWTEHTNATISDYVLGPYVTNSSAGLRTHPYSTNTTTNPLTYASVANLTEVHQIGEVWANTLHNVYAALVGEHGFSAQAFTDPTGSAGDVVFLHLFMDALSIQPCNPTFVNARDSWIQADATRYDGANRCILWRTFASKGLGVNAANYQNDFTVPSGC